MNQPTPPESLKRDDAGGSAAAVPPAPHDVPAITGDVDVDVLARTLYGEARGEPVRGKEAIAAVVVNRVAVAQRRGGHWWGDTVARVCLAEKQFACWNPGDPNREKLLSATRQSPGMAVCLRIARRACKGLLDDPTDGATHYHANHITPRWAEGHAACAAIGNHLFYRDIAAG